MANKKTTQRRTRANRNAPTLKDAAHVFGTVKPSGDSYELVAHTKGDTDKVAAALVGILVSVVEKEPADKIEQIRQLLNDACEAAAASKRAGGETRKDDEA